MSNANAVSPLRAMPLIKMTLKARKVPYLKSSPGIGKSAMAAELAQEFNLKLIDHRISTSAPTDLTGLPEIQNGRSSFNPFDFFPIKGKDEPVKGTNGWLLFLDEFNSGSKAVLAAAYKLVLDKKVGQYDLHPNVAVMCAGNRDTDRAITTNIGTAMQSRLTTYNIELNNDEFINHVMIKQKWDDRVIAYLSSEPNKINDFRPDHSDDTFCCPRTWDSVQEQIKGEKITRAHLPLIGGTITSGVAADFLTFLDVYQDMPKFEDVLREPNSYPLPTNPQLKWAVVSSFSQKTNKKNFNQIATYIGRFDMTFQVLFFRMTLPSNPELRELPEFGPIAVKFAKYMFDAVS